jgi:hypothetical protein
MIIAAVGLGPLGLLRGELSELAAVAWNSVCIVAAGSGGIPGGLFEKCGQKDSPTPPSFIYQSNSIQKRKDYQADYTDRVLSPENQANDKVPWLLPSIRGCRVASGHSPARAPR